jgi:Flp pilus assembly protein TadG
MQKNLRSILAAAALIVLAGSTFGGATTAQADDKAKAAPAAAATTTPKTKVYDFSGDTIEGELIKPEGSSVDARDFAKHSSLIRIRTNFIPEIVKSAEDL